MGLFFLTKSIKGPQVELIVDEVGINDTSTPTAIGLDKMGGNNQNRVIRHRGHFVLLIQVVNPEQYLERTKYFSRRSLKVGIKMYGTPVIISAHSLKYNFDELEDLLYISLEKYKKEK